MTLLQRDYNLSFYIFVISFFVICSQSRAEVIDSTNNRDSYIGETRIVNKTEIPSIYITNNATIVINEQAIIKDVKLEYVNSIPTNKINNQPEQVKPRELIEEKVSFVKRVEKKKAYKTSNEKRKVLKYPLNPTSTIFQNSPNSICTTTQVQSLLKNIHVSSKEFNFSLVTSTLYTLNFFVLPIEIEKWDYLLSCNLWGRPPPDFYN